MNDNRTDPHTTTGTYLVPDAPTGQALLDLEAEPAWTARAGRRSGTEKFKAGFRGVKHAVRGDSSFFAHGYRGVLIVILAVMLRVDPLGWCLLLISGTFVLLAEFCHSAIDTLARACGDPEETPLRVAREVAAGGVLVAAFASGTLTVVILLVKVGESLGWWGH